MEEKLKKIKLIVSDVDGVLTDGKIYLVGKEEMKAFSVRDASPMEVARQAGIRFLFITSRKCDAVIKRAEELKTDLVFKMDVKAAGGDLISYLKTKYSVSPEEVLYVGDDWSDLFSMKTFGVSATPANGTPENKAIALIVTKANGGEGVLRELIEIVLRAQGVWEKYLAFFTESFSI